MCIALKRSNKKKDLQHVSGSLHADEIKIEIRKETNMTVEWQRCGAMGV